MGRLFQLFWGRDEDFQELGHRPLFNLLRLVSELSWHWWVCHLDANVLQWGSRSTGSPVFRHQDLVGSNQFLSCPMAMSFFERLCPAPFPPVSEVLQGFHKHWILKLNFKLYFNFSVNSNIVAYTLNCGVTLILTY